MQYCSIVFASKNLDLRKSSRDADSSVDIEVRGLMDDLDQFFDESSPDEVPMTDAQEDEPLQSAELASLLESVMSSDEPSSLEQAVLDYIERNPTSS